jgi:AcrR family transcriptional regulator
MAKKPSGRAAGSPTRKRVPGAERRALILKAATRLFAKHHYRSTTLGQIAAEARVSEALICKHFTTKKQLFIATIEATGRYLADNLQTLTQRSETPPLQRLHEAFRFYFDYLNQDHGTARMIFQVSSELDDKEVRDALAVALRRAAAIIRRALELGQREGLVRRDINLESVTWLIVGCYQVFALMKQVGGEETWKESTLLGFVTPILEPRYANEVLQRAAAPAERAQRQPEQGEAS